MRKVAMIFVLIVLVISCEKSEKVCNCKNPLEELTWLNGLKSSITNCSCETSIFQATYKQQTVFFSMMNDPLCNGYQQINLFSCSGETVKSYATTDQAFADEVTDRKNIYSCKTK